jgi:DNA-binding NtrC family response regulator
MVVLAPTSEIRASDIPSDVREQGRDRLLPVRVPGLAREVAGQELAYIVQSLLDLRLQVEDLRRRIDDRPHRVEVIDLPRGAGTVAEYVDAVEVGAEGQAGRGGAEPPESVVLYRTGMRMAEVERAAIEAALKDTRGNRRKAAEMLGIGERTLYRKLKEYEIEEVDT